MALTTALIQLISIIALFFLISPSSCSDHKQHSSGVVVVEEKAKLGSTPPSCHNKCKMCQPCAAVQVATMPSQHRVDPSSDESSSTGGYRYSNYKPLKWSCKCNGQFYNP
ncbi:hypothetical protein ACS0TY_030771 [Phlomoides rotata]